MPTPSDSTPRGCSVADGAIARITTRSTEQRQRLQALLDAVAQDPTDRKAGAELLDLLLRWLPAYLKGKVGLYDDAMLIAADTALAVLTAAGKGKPIREVGGVFTACDYARAQFFKHRARQKRKPPQPVMSLEDLQAEPLPTSSLSLPEELMERWELHDQLASLPSRMGEVLTLRFLEDRTRAEIAVLLGIHPEKVRRLEDKGLQMMRELLTA